MIIIVLWVWLKSTYFVKIEKFLLKVLYMKIKVNWNSKVEPTNNTKKCSGPINSRKNKLNNKISWLYNFFQTHTTYYYYYYYYYYY